MKKYILIILILFLISYCTQRVKNNITTNPYKINLYDSKGKKKGVWITKTKNGFEKINFIKGKKDGLFIEFGIKKNDTIITKKGFFKNGVDLNKWYYFYGADSYFLEENKVKFNKKIFFRNDSVKFEWKSKITNFRIKDSSKISSGYVLYDNDDIFLGENIRYGKWVFYKKDSIKEFIYKEPVLDNGAD